MFLRDKYIWNISVSLTDSLSVKPDYLANRTITVYLCHWLEKWTDHYRFVTVCTFSLYRGIQFFDGCKLKIFIINDTKRETNRFHSQSNKVHQKNVNVSIGLLNITMRCLLLRNESLELTWNSFYAWLQVRVHILLDLVRKVVTISIVYWKMILMMPSWSLVALVTQDKDLYSGFHDSYLCCLIKSWESYTSRRANNDLSG